MSKERARLHLQDREEYQRLFWAATALPGRVSRWDNRPHTVGSMRAACLMENDMQDPRPLLDLYNEIIATYDKGINENTPWGGVVQDFEREIFTASTMALEELLTPTAREFYQRGWKDA